MCNKEWLGSFFIESTLSCMCAEGLLFASIGGRMFCCLEGGEYD